MVYRKPALPIKDALDLAIGVGYLELEGHKLSLTVKGHSLLAGSQLIIQTSQVYPTL